jgi:hypothetical protein
MKIYESLEVVLNLAMENSLTAEDCDGDATLTQEMERQQMAIEEVTDLLEGYRHNDQ